MKYSPDYRNIVGAATNKRTPIIPMYEHIISAKVLSEIEGRNIFELGDGTSSARKEMYSRYIDAIVRLGYDAPPYEFCLTSVLEGAGALNRSQGTEGCIRDMDDFRSYSWDRLFDAYVSRFGPMLEDMSEVTNQMGVKLIGGVGNGLFEAVQDLVGYENLCLMSYDDPELYAMLFDILGDVLYRVWGWMLENYGHLWAVCRFGDDLGFKSATLLPPSDIKKHLIPQYKRVIALIHSYGKPFLLHSCGNTFAVMDALIDEAGIDAKHSNEDVIAPFDEWVRRYKDRIGLFGGIDVDFLCTNDEDDIRAYVKDLYDRVKDLPGIALGSGNSIPDYMPTENYLAMVETIREARVGQRAEMFGV